jgi:hypothetical protein
MARYVAHDGAPLGLRHLVPDVAPHDLRRTYAKLAHKGGAKVDQIQLSLGHASRTTTERYLGVHQDLNDAPCDYIRLDLSAADTVVVDPVSGEQLNVYFCQFEGRKQCLHLVGFSGCLAPRRWSCCP